MVPKSVAIALLAALIILSGCSGSAIPNSSSQNCAIDSLTFYRTGEYHGWQSDKLRVGYELSGEADLLLVAYENATVLGETQITSEGGVAADGEPIPLNNALEGSHTVRVLAYEDTNQNGKFDPENDSQCSVQTESITVNFSALNQSAAQS